MIQLARGLFAIHALAFLGTLALPVGYFLFKVMAGGPGTSWTHALAWPPVIKAFLNTLVLSTGSALASTAAAFGFSWFLWRFELPRRPARLTVTLLKIPYLLPPFLFAMGWIAWGAPEVGYANQLAKTLGLPGSWTIYSLEGAIWVLTLWNTAFGMIQLQPFFDTFPGHLEDAALICGARPGQVLWRITLPLARPHLASCALLSFLSSAAAFGVPAMLAAPARQYVLTTRIYQSLKAGGSLESASEAGFLSLILLVLAAIVLMIQARLTSGPSAATLTGKAARPSSLKPSGVHFAIFGLIALYALISVVLPVAGVALQSILRDRADPFSWTLERYAYVFLDLPETGLSLRNSLITAAIAAFLSTALASVLAYSAVRFRAIPTGRASRALLELWNLGYALPGTVIALALLVFFSGSLTDTLTILVLAYFAKYCAFALRILAPAIANLAPELEEAAWMSGATRAKGFARIVLPLLKPALVAALLLSFLPMFSELTLSVLLAGAGTETLGVLIYRFQEYADPGSAAVLGVLLVALTLLCNLALRIATRGRFGI